MFDARQRAVLHALGIPVWIPSASTLVPIDDQRVPEHSIWRSAAAENAQSIEQMDAPSEQTPVAVAQSVMSDAEQAQAAHNADQAKTNVLAYLSEPTAAPTEIAIEALNAPDSGTVVDAPILPKASPQQSVVTCHLQACEINQWIVIVDERELEQAQHKQLWDNICQAFLRHKQQQARVYHFAWPLSDGARWQGAVGAKPALSGFLFRMGLDKRIGVMSELEDAFCTDRMERLPTLSELLAEPLKKRMLWQVLK